MNYPDEHVSLNNENQIYFVVAFVRIFLLGASKDRQHIKSGILKWQWIISNKRHIWHRIYESDGPIQLATCRIPVAEKNGAATALVMIYIRLVSMVHFFGLAAKRPRFSPIYRLNHTSEKVTSWVWRSIWMCPSSISHSTEWKWEERSATSILMECSFQSWAARRNWGRWNWFSKNWKKGLDLIDK